MLPDELIAQIEQLRFTIEFIRGGEWMQGSFISTCDWTNSNRREDRCFDGTAATGSIGPYEPDRGREPGGVRVAWAAALTDG